MNPIEEALKALTKQQQAKLARAWDAFQRGMIDREMFVDLAINTLLGGNAKGYLLGMATIRGEIEAVTGTVELVTPPPATTGDVKRLGKALDTILASNLDTTMQLARLAEGEITHAAAKGAEEVVSRSKRVKGWTRALNVEACQLCRWWWRDGRVWQPDHPMPRHTGCMCMQRPIVSTTSNYQTVRQAKKAANTNRLRERKKQ